jgi:hypothetical protein
MSVPQKRLLNRCLPQLRDRKEPVDSAHSDPSAAAELIVKLSPAALDPKRPEYRAVKDCVTALGIEAAPLHAGTSDPQLATYLVAHVELEAINQVVERLVACDGVEGAYVKPAGEPPEGSVHHA